MPSLITIRIEDQPFQLASLLALLQRNDIDVRNTMSASCDGIMFRNIVVENDLVTRAKEVLDYLGQEYVIYLLEDLPANPRPKILSNAILNQKNITRSDRLHFLMGIPGENGRVFLGVTISDEEQNLQKAIELINVGYPVSYRQNIDQKTIWDYDRLTSIFSVVMGRELSLTGDILPTLIEAKIDLRTLLVGACGFVDGSQDETISFRQLIIIPDAKQNPENMANAFHKIHLTQSAKGYRFDWRQQRMIVVKQLQDSQKTTVDIAFLAAYLGGNNHERVKINIDTTVIFPEDGQNQQMIYSLGHRLAV